MQFDKNKDGKISKEEAPGRFRERFDLMDINKDGFTDESELREFNGRFRNAPRGTFRNRE